MKALTYYVLFTLSVLLWFVWFSAFLRFDATLMLAAVACQYILRLEMAKVKP